MKVDALSFRLPAGLSDVGTDVLDCSCISAALGELADRMGKTPDQLLALFKNADLLAIDRHRAEQGEANTLMVQKIPASSLPNEQELRAGLGAVGAVVESFTSSESGAGPVVVADSRLTIASGSVYERSILVVAGTQVVDIIVAARTQDERSRLGDAVQSTLTTDPV